MRVAVHNAVYFIGGVIIAAAVYFVFFDSQFPSAVNETVSYADYQRLSRIAIFFVILSAIATICSFALYLKQRSVNQIIHQQSITDELTQIHNRRSIFSILKQEMERAKRHKRSLAIVCIDIDFFKNINDTYGHQIGDVVLTQVTSICAEALRTEDHVGRIGGEEYLAVLPDTDIKTGFLAAERVRLAVEKYDFSHVSKDLKVTISLGLTEYLGELDRREDLYQRADLALYEAKHSGRNQVKSNLTN